MASTLTYAHRVAELKAANAALRCQLEQAIENETLLLAAVIRNGRPRLSEEEDPCTTS